MTVYGINITCFQTRVNSESFTDKTQTTPLKSFWLHKGMKQTCLAEKPCFSAIKTKSRSMAWASVPFLLILRLPKESLADSPSLNS
jgi:hypothetical protein